MNAEDAAIPATVVLPIFITKLVGVPPILFGIKNEIATPGLPVIVMPLSETLQHVAEEFATQILVVQAGSDARVTNLGVGDIVGVGVLVLVGDTVGVGVLVGVGETVGVGVGVSVGVGVFVGAHVGTGGSIGGD